MPSPPDVCIDMNRASLPHAFAAIAFVLGAAVACGGTAASSPPSPATIVVGQEQAGKTVTAKVGDTVRVKLTEEFPVPGSSLLWDVTSSRPTVLKLTSVTRDPAERPRQGTVSYTAEFVARAGGSADLIARGSRTCEAMTGPGCQNVNFTITVKVA